MLGRTDRSMLRKVFFFRTANVNAVLPSIQLALQHIDGLGFDDQGRYLPTVSEDIVLAVFVTRTSFPVRFQFGRIKRSDLPLIENRGVVEPLKIARSAGVLDWGHMVLFPDGIIAAEFNRDAPRISRLGDYLFFKARGILDDAPRFSSLFERSVLNELAKFEAVTFLEVEAPTDEAESIAEADKDLGSAFGACRRAGNSKSARLILRAPPKGLPSHLQDLAKRLLSNPRSREALTELRVRGKTEKGTRPLDLLESYLISTEQFMRLDGRTRAIASDDAFGVLERAYHEGQHRFVGAATAAEPW